MHHSQLLSYNTEYYEMPHLIWVFSRDSAGNNVAMCSRLWDRAAVKSGKEVMKGSNDNTSGRGKLYCTVVCRTISRWILHQYCCYVSYSDLLKLYLRKGIMQTASSCLLVEVNG